MKIIDLSQPITNEMPVYPGDIKTRLRQNAFINKDKYTSFILETGMHAGTHIDSPMHMLEGSDFISEAPPESFIGEGCLLDVRNQTVIKMKREYEEQVKEGSVVIFHTVWDKYYGSKDYYEKHPVLDLELCNFLIGKKIKLVGIDMPTPDYCPFEIHKLLLVNGICILENLTNLDELRAIDSFEIIALPLKIKADSSVTRAVARISGK